MRGRALGAACLISSGVALALGGAGCDDKPNEPEVEPCFCLPTSTPAELVRAIEVIYNDKVRSAAERLEAYGNLLSPDFRFFLQPADWDTCGCQDWGRDEEIQVHRNIFEKQQNRQIYSLEVRIQHAPADTLNPAEPGREEWRVVFANNVYLKLLTSPDNGWEMNGGQAEFKMQPLDGRWYIGEWRDLPRF